VLGGPDACWPWKGYASPRSGYGVAGAGKRPSAHRFAFRLVQGAPGPLSVLHWCDNRCCGTPSHLWLGTELQNLQDAHRKGRPIRARPGEDNPHATLTQAAVREIRATHRRTKAWAAQFGVTEATIQAVRRGRAARSMTGPPSQRE
jgi:hypothetical protein